MSRALSAKDFCDYYEKYCMYEVTNKGIIDYHTQGVEVPAALFKNAFQEPPAEARLPGARQTEESAPLLSVAVKCESAGQYVGAAKRDLYLLAAEGSFAWNFFKGAIGLWMLTRMLTLGLRIRSNRWMVTGAVR